MLSRKIVLPLLFLCLLSGCAKKRPATATDYYASSEYQNRDVLSQSLFKSDQAVLSNDEIEKILGSKIQLPRQAHLTVLRLGSSQEVLSWAFLSGSENPLSVLDSSPRLTRVSWLPSLLVPEKLTVSLLREAAARFLTFEEVPLAFLGLLGFVCGKGRDFSVDKWLDIEHRGEGRQRLAHAVASFL